MRVKVAYQNHQLVIPTGPPHNPVNRLLLDISQRFSSHLGRPIELVRLRTHDGYEFDGSDRIGDVIADGELVVAIDVTGWMEQVISNTECEEWAVIRQADFAQDTTRWAKCGLDIARNRLYVELGYGHETKKLEIINVETLLSLPPASGDRILIDMITGKKDGSAWHAAACYIRDVIYPMRACAIELQVQSLSDPQPEIIRVHIEYQPGEDGAEVPTLTRGDISIVQSSHPKPPAGKVYITPGSEQDGPTLSANLEDYVLPRPLKDHPNISTGSSMLSMTQLTHIFAEQSWSYRGASQFLSVEVRVTNTDEEVGCVIVGIRAEYKNLAKAQADANDGWIPVTRVRSGKKESTYHYLCRDPADAVIDIGKGEVIKLALQAEIEIDRSQHHPPMDTRLRRLHAPSFLKKDCDSLPIRFVVIDKYGKEACIEMVAHQMPPELPTPESYLLSRPGQEIYRWIFCDDVATGERLCVPITRGWGKEGAAVGGGISGEEDEFRLEFKYLGGPSREYYVTRTCLRRWAWRARLEGTDLLEIEEWSWRDGGLFNVEVAAVVDREDELTYALMFRLRTGTGTVIECVPMPKELW